MVLVLNLCIKIYLKAILREEYYFGLERFNIWKPAKKNVFLNSLEPRMSVLSKMFGSLILPILINGTYQRPEALITNTILEFHTCLFNISLF